MDLKSETTTPVIKPPPPIFIRVVNDFNAFCDSIKNLTKGEHFSCKSYTNGVKLSTTSANSYRSIIKFKATKRILNKKNSIIPIRYPDRSLAKTNLEKSNLFAFILKNNFTPHPDVNNIDHTSYTEKSLTNCFPMPSPIKHTSPREIQFIINKLPNNKSPGHGLITNRIIKHLPKKTILLLTFIFNSILRLSHIPLSWKHSIIILIPKPDKPSDLPSSYRPISLLPSFSKILEKITKAIKPYIIKPKYNPPHSIRFQK